MMNQLTHHQARTLAAFIASIRPDWDKPGIEDALGRARTLAPGPDLAIAAIRASQAASNRTPAVIGLEGPHWRGSESTPVRPPSDPHSTCSVCSMPQHVCESRWGDDHAFLPKTAPRSGAYAEHVAELRRTCSPGSVAAVPLEAERSKTDA